MYITTIFSAGECPTQVCEGHSLMFPWDVSAVHGMALIYRRLSWAKTLLKQNPGGDLNFFDERLFLNGSANLLQGVRQNDTGLYTFYANPNDRSDCVVNLKVIPREGKSIDIHVYLFFSEDCAVQRFANINQYIYIYILQGHQLSPVGLSTLSPAP